MKHRSILPLLVLLALVFACAASAANAPFFFVQLADTQLGFTNANKDMDPEIANFTRAVKDINRLKPAFVLLCGDTINKTHDIPQVRAFWRIAREIDKSIPLYILPGNHDVTNSPTASDIRFFERVYGPDHYSFSVNSSQFIVLNSPLMSKAADSDLGVAQLKWFESELKAAKLKNPSHIFVCQHQPWFLKTPDEADKYQNVPLVYRKIYLDLMNQYGVKYSLSGHLHYDLTARDRNLNIVSCGPVSRELRGPLAATTDVPLKVGYRIWKVYPDRVETQFYTLGKVPEKVRF